ncbi:MAG: phosphopyruvate hydratase [Candidatus Pacebacteria bacterium CG_4_10_14_0_8_um_filter_42_14]|nr:MAG: phosphopyruvate hydratase [Candidatus Pacebacteria bacterium CG_4_10_14_0_8_um_filter_42_14]
MKITQINAHEILASGGFPSIEAIVQLEDGSLGRASVPYGASAGSYEASVLLDGDESRYGGKGMLKAVKIVLETIAPQVINREFGSQAEFDRFLIDLDGTPQKTTLGGNTILVLSLAFARAGANSQHQELYQYLKISFSINSPLQLPQPMLVTIEGGKHAENSTNMQEYSLSATRQSSLVENIRMVLETYHIAESVLKEKGFSTNVGHEGAFAPEGITSNELPLEILTEGILRSGYAAKTEIGISIDPAASEYYQDGKYNLSIENKQLSSDEMIQYYRPWLEKYPLVTIEDPLHEDDWSAWPKMRELCDEFSIPLIGDDLTVTNIKILQRAIDEKAITGILIKLNQIGSVTETIETCLLAKQHNMLVVPSHRGGGETNDTAMIDLAVAVGAEFVKVGPTRGERVAKYNRLLEIERKEKA